MAQIVRAIGTRLSITAISFAGLFAAFLICLPSYPVLSWKSEWKSGAVPYLKNCPRNDVRFGFFSPRNLLGVKGHVDLQNGDFAVFRDGAISHFGGDEGRKNGGQILQLKQLTQNLPDHRKWFFEPYDFDDYIYIAVNEGHALRIFEYPLGNLPQEVQDFLNGINPGETKNEFKL